MKIKLAGLGTIFKKTYTGWNDDDPFRQSAVIAYYAIFSLPALLVLIINVAGLFFGREAVAGEISRQVESAMGAKTAAQVNQIVTKAGETEAGLWSTIIAVITIIFGATGVFVQLKKTLNQIWDVRQKLNEGLKMLRNRLFSFGLIVSIGFLLLMSLVISTALAALSNRLEAIFPKGITYLFFGLEIALSLSVITLLFALMFKVLPDVKMKRNDVLIGSFLTAVLFTLGKYGLSFYFGRSEPASVYGAAGSIVLILLWSSYSSMIVFFGAEFTKQFAVYHGHEILPTKNAEKIPGDVNSLTQEHNAAQKKETARIKEDYKKDETKKSKKEYVVKNKRELQKEIDTLEKRLEGDKEGIRDNLKPVHFFTGLFTGMLSLRKKSGRSDGIDGYLKGVVRNHITPARPKGWLDRIKKLLHIRQNGELKKIIKQ